MGEINWGRLALGALVAGILAFLLDGLLHAVLLKPLWVALAKSYGQTGNEPGDPTDFVYYGLYDLAKGAAAVWVYALARKQLGPGPRTAILAGLTVWALTVPIPLGGELPFHWFGRRIAFFWSLYGLPFAVISALGGAWVYRPKVIAGSPAQP